MLPWIVANSGNIIVISVLGLIVAAVIAGMIRDRKKGKHCTGCASCSACSSCSSCGSCSGCGAEK